MFRTYAEWRVFRTYAEWRATVKFTDAEIVAALRAEAANMPHEFVKQRYVRLAGHLERTGRLSGLMLRLTLGRLVSTCWVCGDVALYRLGTFGMCRKHKSMSPPEVRAWRREQDRRSLEIQANKNADRRQDQIRDRSKQRSMAMTYPTHR